MIQVYEILDKIKAHFEGNGITNKVSFGSGYDIDKDKTTRMPLAHLDIISAEYVGHAVKFTIRVLCIDMLSESKEAEPLDEFFGGDNRHDVYNTQFIALTQLINSLKRGDLFDDKHQLTNEPVAEIYEDALENRITGWGADIQINVKNDISVC